MLRPLLSEPLSPSTTRAGCPRALMGMGCWHSSHTDESAGIEVTLPLCERKMPIPEWHGGSGSGLAELF